MVTGGNCGKNRMNQSMKVFKFGGSSVGTPERIDEIASWFHQAVEKEQCRAVIFSAFQGVTDQLISMAEKAGKGDDTYTNDLGRLEERHIEAVRKLLSTSEQSQAVASVKFMLNDLEDILQGVFLVKELTPRSLDFISSFGERLSNYIIHLAFRKHGIACDFLDARKVIVTDDQFGSAEVDMEKSLANIQVHFASSDRLQVVTGFIAANEKGVTTTLGRGGSDYTAAIFAAALDVEELQIWTDVDGVLTADPRLVREAFSMDVLSYEEAMELSHFGAKVIHPPTIEPAMSRNIPIRIKNTLNPAFPGTLVGNFSGGPEYIIKGISSIDHVALIRIQGSGLVGMAGVAQRIFGALAAGSINIILITQASSEHSVCLAVLPKHASRAKRLLQKELQHEMATHRVADIIIEDELSTIAVVGENMRQTPGIAGKVFQALGRSRINISAIAQGSTELNISAVIRRADKQKALRVIHDAFFYGARKTVQIYVAGTGLIGRQLISDIFEKQEWFLTERHLDLRINGILNSRKMLLDEHGLAGSDWEQQLEASPRNPDPNALLEFVKIHQSPNTIFVDATASDDLPACYEQFLAQGVAVVTPNKKANTGSWEQYRKLSALARDNDTRFLYETNVGAGLPFVQAVSDRVASGDKVTRLDGVFSGTLSYLFNSFDGSKPFSELVRDARENGYTEPDPRDDLNGMDAARKLLILARLTGQEVSLEDIHVENLVPENLRGDIPVDVFLEKLQESDAVFEEKLQAARKEGKVLRYLASMDGDGLRAGLAAVGPDNPVYSLGGAENMLTITSEAYSEIPLVIKGPGAGAVVTANGVLSDIVKVIH
ncbi:MAG: bifunctional aspartate kinase/homoserine dehydrogenase I [Balneolaceae bacterium]|nr:MAG: bifunctional aspartate kinase/homoserine dehydrogenase I [Balneolaceae bacterium]